MKAKRCALIGLLFIFSATIIGCAGGLGAAAVISAVVYYEAKEKMDIAEVELKAKPEAIYKAALDVAKKTPDVKIIKQDDKKMTLDFTRGDRDATLIIKAKNDGYSLLTIESKKSKDTEEKTPTLVLEAVKKICDEMGIQYKVEAKKK